MSIDASEVRRIAALARLDIPAAEGEALARDLERILLHIAALSRVELPADSDALTYFEADVHREDRTAPGLGIEQALANAPETDGERFLVPKIVDRDAE
ncbi:MAG: Asp-tRNA(Asn)/Glu-tRNA(Gln) amidotransferase subunit GatC [Planctomycetaceae bacterium]